MLSSASSNRPGAIGLRVGERAFDVTEQFALEQRFGQAAHVHRDHAVRRARRERVQRLRDQTFAGAVFAGDQHVRVRRRDALNHFDHRSHRRRFRDQVRNVAARSLFAASSFRPLRNALAELDLRPHNREQPLVVPRFRNKIARAAFHRLDREIDRRPRRHHHDRQRAVERLDFRNDFETFLARSRVARVIQVHHQQRVIALLKRVENSADRRDRLGLMAFALEQNAQRFQHIALVVGNQNPAHGLTLNRYSGQLSTALFEVRRNPTREWSEAGRRDIDRKTRGARVSEREANESKRSESTANPSFYSYRNASSG